MCCGRESGSGGKDGAVAGVEGGAEEEDGGDAADNLGEVCGLVGAKGAVQEGRRGFRGELAVAEPLLEDLIAAEGVIPDVDGHGGPVGVAVEMDIDAGFAEQGKRCLIKRERIGRLERAASLFALGLGPWAFGGKAAARA